MFKRIATAVLLLFLGTGAAWMYFSLHAPLSAAAPVILQIPPGTGQWRALTLLQTHGLLKDRVSAALYLRLKTDRRHVQAGEYGFTGELTAGRVLDKVLNGEVLLHRVTFPEGRTSFEYARILEGAGICPAKDFLAAVKAITLVQPIRVGADTLEGFLFPDTYQFPRFLPARKAVQAFLAKFEKIRASRSADLAKQKLDPYAWLTLASIVEREARAPSEQAVIAGVFLNRLAIGMPLQADPTVLYALERRSTPVDRLTHADLQVDSRYNTYRYAGLPPGPIGNPGAGALDAVLHPSKHRYLYFVARPDSTHAFAATLEEHNRNVTRLKHPAP